MLQRSIHIRFNANARLAALLCWTIGALAGAGLALAGDTAQAGEYG
jgi:hypothetical protein